MRRATKRVSALASSSSTEPEWFRIGRLGRPHGLDGFLGLYADEDDMVGLEPGSIVYLDERPLEVRAVRRIDRGYQIAFEGIHDREGAEEIRAKDLAVAGRRPLGEGEFWPRDLIGLTAFDQSDRPVGVIRDVLHGPAQDRLLVERSGGATFEVPFVDALVPEVDLAAGRVDIVSIPGLIEPSR